MPCIHTHHMKTLIGIYKTDAITLLSHWKFTGSKNDLTQAVLKNHFGLIGNYLNSTGFFVLLILLISRKYY